MKSALADLAGLRRSVTVMGGAGNPDCLLLGGGLVGVGRPVVDEPPGAAVPTGGQQLPGR